MTKRIILPNQLFPLEQLPPTWRRSSVWIVEEPIYFGFRPAIPKGREDLREVVTPEMKFNKLKLILHRSSMKHYEQYLQTSNFFSKVHYLDLADCMKQCYADGEAIEMIDPVDHYLGDRLRSVAKSVEMHDNPSFAISLDDMKEYHLTQGQSKRYVQQHFYEFVKKKVGILVGVASRDSENRSAIPDIKAPAMKRTTGILKTSLDKTTLEAVAYIEKHFPKNPGSSDMKYPVTRDEAMGLLGEFLQTRFKEFGKFQDAMLHGAAFLSHSVISSSLNIGLITVKDVVDAVRPLVKKVAMNNVEGFIRQVLGWREYQRYMYTYEYKTMISTNYFGHTSLLREDIWWPNAGKKHPTGIVPVDDALNQAWSLGYLHHIYRLMVMSNIFNLLRVDPHCCYKWFMEFSVDSYDWVMIQNVYSMGQWADGGLSMRKPYISSDNYITKMSNYKSGEWCNQWKSLFYAYLADHEAELAKTPYIRNLTHWNKKSPSEQKAVRAAADNACSRLTKQPRKRSRSVS